MPPHQRMDFQQQGPVAPQINKSINIFSKINEDIKALNASMLIISQKINHLARNEKILGRNHIILSKKIRELQERPSQQTSEVSETISAELASINKRLAEQLERIIKLESELEYIKQNYAKQEQVQEMKYVVDTINPLEFVTIKNVKEIVKEELHKKKE
ncbi:MAG: hypothetical protein QXZ13_00245 [Candidatus Diapherotrites archaeon]